MVTACAAGIGSVVRSYCMMPDDRFQRWVDTILTAGAIESSMTALVQGLHHSITVSSRKHPFSVLNQRQSSSSSPRVSSRRPIERVLFRCLQAYELVRALDQRSRARCSSSCRPSPHIVFLTFEFQMEQFAFHSLKRRQRADFPIDEVPSRLRSLVAISGLAWHLARPTYIHQRELSN